MEGMQEAMDIQREQLERLNDFLGPMNPPMSTTKRQSTITFSNPAAEQFFVDGTTIPDGMCGPQSSFGLMSRISEFRRRSLVVGLNAYFWRSKRDPQAFLLVVDTFRIIFESTNELEGFGPLTTLPTRKICCSGPTVCIIFSFVSQGIYCPQAVRDAAVSRVSCRRMGRYVNTLSRFVSGG